MPSKPRKSLEPFLKDSVEFYDHQVTGIRQMIKMRNFLLADDMGLGKSLQAITVATADIKREWASKILVVCPINLKTNWSDELVKFTRLKWMILGQAFHPKDPDRLVSLPPKKREEQLKEFESWEGPKVLIANYEQANKHVADWNRIGFDIVIFDEAHYLKNPKSQRTKACHKISFNRVFALTGTPMLNQVDELWGILHLIDRGAFPNYYRFVNRYCVFGGYEGRQIVGVKNERELTKNLNAVMIRRLKKDVLDLPDVQIIQKKISLNDKQQKLYDKVDDELLLDRYDVDDPEEIDNALTRLLRLKQICGSTFTFTGEDHSAKLDVAIEDAIEILHQGEKLVVFTQFRDILELFCRRLDAAAPQFDIWELHGGVKSYDRQGVVKEWSSSSEPGVIVCGLQVAGIGLNMTAARHGQFLDKLWVPGLNQQAIDRMHRIGASETQPVQIIEYLMRGTVETRVEAILKNKSKLFGTVVNEPDFKRKLLAAMRAKEDQ